MNILGELRRTPHVVSYALYLYMMASVAALCMLTIRYVVLSALGEAPAGLLQVSLSVALTVGAVLYTMSGLYLAPLVNRRSPVADKCAASNLFVVQLLVLFLLGSMPVLLFPRSLITLLYAGAFTAATASVFGFVIWQCIYQVANVYQHLLIGLNDGRYVSVSAAIGFGLAALLGVALVGRLGLFGAAVALAIGMAVYLGAMVGRLHWRHSAGVPLAVYGRFALVLVAICGAGVLFGSGSGELTLSGASQRIGYGAIALTGFWSMLNSGERHGILGIVKDAAAWRNRKSPR